MPDTAAAPIEVLQQYHPADTAGPTTTVAAAQLGGPWLQVEHRLARLVDAATSAAAHGADLVAFPEVYLSGYPFWLSRTGGASFDDADQKECYAYYLDAAVEIGGRVHRELETLSSDLGVTLVVGLTERGRVAGRGSTYCAVLTIDPAAGTVGHHRKLVPTYDERLVWTQGDGAGLVVHPVGNARVGALSCWENWMPHARSALHAQGEDIHLGLWPGSAALTADVTRFTAKEGRAYGVAVAGLIRARDVPDDFPLADRLRAATDDDAFDGGSAVAGPDGQWLVEPVTGREGLVIAELPLHRVLAERLTFDPAGHYARPDVFHNEVDRRRAVHTTFLDGPPPGAAR